MRVLITTAIFPPEIGGPASYVPEIIKRLKEHASKVLTFTKNLERYAGTQVVSVTQRGGSLIRQINLVQKILKYGSNCEVFYAQDPLVVGLATVIVGKLVGKRALIKYVGGPAWETAFANGRTQKFLPNFLDHTDAGLTYLIIKFLTKISFNLSDAIIVPSKFLADIVADKYGVIKLKIRVIYNAVEIPETAKRVFRKKDVYRVIYFGRLVPWKNVDGIIEAVALVNKQRRKCWGLSGATDQARVPC